MTSNIWLRKKTTSTSLKFLFKILKPIILQPPKKIRNPISKEKNTITLKGLKAL